ncbi:hypothetical protein [Caldivirga maquilingensis]|uniref:Uncharacterized protein n=1 Tax=Caldivirga maquilingensis (strain ATCC 700844 / DSM 13496 / JCM 10307 / IC-167) TaxID=397948 RepID=A8M9N9_CALMQ|nr:hypothetical protein [Caldivirga maquilingensis]ABW00920.1 hypothetical protein Cmaq_0066 [Caldivirga maquilingensis IC-167]
MAKSIFDLITDINGVKRGKVMVIRELLRVLEYVDSSSKGNVVYISYRRIIGIIQHHRKLSNEDKSMIKSTLSSIITDVNARRINKDKCIYVVDKGALSLMIMRLKEALSE